jgi:molybdopterin-guanine dinucleotide biosynthesis protein A
VAAEFAAVVLAGGRARRLGGVDKVLLPVGGRSLLDRTLDAVAEADPVIVVGTQRATTRPVQWTLEDPPGGGPLAALYAGLLALPTATPLVAVLAGDHPHLTPATTERLLAALRATPEATGAILTAADGMPQWLAGMWRTEALREAMPPHVQNAPLRSALAPLEPLRVPATATEVSDVDTPEDLTRARSTKE